MLDFGFFELLTIIALAVIVIGPQDIPKVMLGLGRIVRRLQYVKFALSQQFDEFMREHELKELHESVNFETSRSKSDNKGFDEDAEDESYFGDIKPGPMMDNKEDKPS